MWAAGAERLWKQKGDWVSEQGRKIFSNLLWSAVHILARIISKQASVGKKVQKAASFLFNQTWSCCVHSSDVQAAEGSDSLDRSKGEADNGGRSLWAAQGLPWGSSCASGYQMWCIPQGPEWKPGGVSPSLSNLTRFLSDSSQLQKKDWSACLHDRVLWSFLRWYFEISIGGSVSGKCWEARNTCRGVCGWGLEGNLGSDWMPFVPFILGCCSYCFYQDIFLSQKQNLEL